MKISNQPQTGNLPVVTDVEYVAVQPGDNGPLRRKQSSVTVVDPVQSNCGFGQSNHVLHQNSHAVLEDAKFSSEQKIIALGDLIMELPEGGAREILSESFTAIIHGEGDIKYLRALTMRAARQLRTMYLSGGERALAADIRWRVREFVWDCFEILLYISPKGLHLAEGLSPSELNAFLKIESNGHVWAGEVYEEADEGPLTLPLTTEDVFQRLSDKLLRSIY